MLAKELDISFYDADDFHSAESVEKMRSGSTLDDNDRLPWLRRMAEEMNLLGSMVENICFTNDDTFG